MNKRADADSTPPGADQGWAALSTLIGGFGVWGGIGWALDRWWGTHFLTPTGLIVGMVLGIYAVVARQGGFSTPPRGLPQQPTRPAAYNLQLYRPNRPPAESGRPSPAPPPSPARQSSPEQRSSPEHRFRPAHSPGMQFDPQPGPPPANPRRETECP